MSNKLTYWVPIVGVFVTLIHYERDNGMSVGWCYYQAAMLVIIIWVVSFFSTS